jgi:hypothetical protein
MLLLPRRQRSRANRFVTRKHLLESLERRELLATVALFDTGAVDSSYQFATAGAASSPALVSGGIAPQANGRFLRLYPGASNVSNSVAFSRTDAGAYDRVVLDFDFRITPTVRRPEGLSFALLNTATFGNSGSVAPFDSNPSLAGSLSVRFAMAGPYWVPNVNNVEVWYDSKLVAVIDCCDHHGGHDDECLSVDLAGGQWIHARAIIHDGEFTLEMTPAYGETKTVVHHLAIPNFTPYESRLAFSGFSGNTMYGSADIDNVNLQYLGSSQSLISMSPLRVVVGERTPQAIVTVERTGNVSLPATVNFHTAGYSAQAPGDFTATSGTIQFAASQRQATIAIPIVDDAIVEATEQFAVRLTTASSGAVVGGPREQFVTILDDENMRSKGVFGPVTPMPLVAIHTILLPTGEVLMLDEDTSHHHGFLWNPVTQKTRATAHVPRDPVTNKPVHLFCSAHTLLADGRVFFAGGHDGFVGGFARGIFDATIYDPFNDTWQALPKMQFARWYPTVHVTPEGEVVIMSGTDETATNTISKYIEVYTPHKDGSWTRRTLDVSQDEADNDLAHLHFIYPKMFHVPDGRIFVLGTAGLTWWLDLKQEGTPNVWTQGPRTNASQSRNDYGTATMVDSTTVVLIGGGGGSSPGTVWGTPQSSVELLDLSQPNPRWHLADPLPGNLGRRHHNATTLPGGEILVTGGTSSGRNELAGAVHEAMIFRHWAPAGSQWQVLSAAENPRLYHSTALLLPNGEVFTGGMGQRPPVGTYDMWNYEIFHPMYMGQKVRPTVTAPATEWDYGQQIVLNATAPGDIFRVVLMKPGSVTHTMDENGRRIPLRFRTDSGSRVIVETPTNMNTAPPGDYLLFVVDSKGGVSAGQWIKLQERKIALSSNVIAEKVRIGTPVGEFFTRGNETQSLAYSLVSGAGDVDNSRFQIVGSELRSQESFSITGQTSFSLRVRATHSSGVVAEHTLHVHVVRNHAPILNLNVVASLIQIAEDNRADWGTPIWQLAAGIADADNGAFRGLAISSAQTDVGSWEFTLNDGASWQPLGAVSMSNARLLPSDGNLSRLRFVPAPNYHGTAFVGYFAWDQTQGSAGGLYNLSPDGSLGGSNAFSHNWRTSTIEVTPLNDAPEMIASLQIPLISIAEDERNSWGTPVWQLIEGTSDVDVGDKRGIAITTAQQSNGGWQFTLNGGATWDWVGGVSISAARLLPSNGNNSRIRFVPNKDFNGTAQIGYFAWDLTQGKSGETFDLSGSGKRGGETAFSVNWRTSSITVTPVNDPPVVSAGGSVGYPLNAAPIVLAANATVSDVDSPHFNGGHLLLRIVQGQDAGNLLLIRGDFSVQNGTVRHGDTNIGTLGNDGIGTRNLRINFNANATRQVAEQLLRSIQFRTIDSTNRSQRVVGILLNDGNANGTSQEVFRTIEVI